MSHENVIKLSNVGRSFYKIKNKQVLDFIISVENDRNTLCM
jgi:hypothetical protein